MFDFDQRELAVRAAEQDADQPPSRRRGRRRRRRRAPSTARAASATDIGLIGLPRGAEDPRHPRRGRARAPPARRRDRLRLERREPRAPLTPRRLRSCHFPFTLLRLLGELVDRLASATSPRCRRRRRACRNCSPRACSVISVAVPVLLARQHDLRRHGAVVQQAIELARACVSTSRRSAGVMST